MWRIEAGIWLALMALAGLSTCLNGVGLSAPAFVLAVLAVAAVKGQLVVDHFMGLRHVQGRWRALLAVYVLGLSGLLALLLRPA